MPLEAPSNTPRSPERPGRGRFRLPGALSVLGLLLAACATCGCSNSASPTLPIPPPAALSSTPDADGLVTITGSRAVEGAMISAYNERLETGVIGVADDLGQFELRLAAASGDPIALWQTVGTNRGEVLTILVPDP